MVVVVVVVVVVKRAEDCFYAWTRWDQGGRMQEEDAAWMAAA